MFETRPPHISMIVGKEEKRPQSLRALEGFPLLQARSSKAETVKQKKLGAAKQRRGRHNSLWRVLTVKVENMAIKEET